MTKTKIILLICLQLVLFLTCRPDDEDSIAGTSTSVTLSSVLQHNMVIQQGKPLTISGKAAPASTIAIIPDWGERQTLEADDSGVFRAEIPVPVASPGDFTAHTLQIGDTKLENLLIGDVWLCSGQSNMAMSMKPFPPYHEGVFNHASEIANANFPHIRLFTVEKDTAVSPTSFYRGKWFMCSPEAVADFSGAAYYFGKSLYQELNIPIGLVVSAYGGAACQAFVSEEDLLADAFLKENFYDAYITTTDKLIHPSWIYNAMIHPLHDMSIKGFVWYQGETNAGHREKYTPLNTALIKNWRKLFDQGSLPFYLVQMTPYNWQGNNYYNDGYAFFREAQEAILSQVENTGIAITMDNKQISTIHPSNKKDVGERLARVALHDTYGRQDVVHKGPHYKSMTIEGNTVSISWDPESLGSGLSTSDGNPPEHFYVAGSDKVFYKAEATIEGDQVVLSSPDVTAPVAVRYAFLTYPVTNLCNKEGLPAFPFRTDHWEYGTTKYHDSHD